MRKEGEDVEEKEDSGIVAKFGHNVLNCSQVTDKNKMHYISVLHQLICSLSLSVG